MALYRKYRPASFAEVIGQEHVTAPLGRALDSGRINHAYLFSGPRGCGKTSSARILARSLNCVHGPTSTPCGECESCKALAPGGSGSLDVTELDAASHRGVEDMRELRDRAIYAPAESRYRVFIIDEAHMITKEGFNALLKIVEEPPAHLIFIFATTEPEKVLTTIKSRTHQYPFRLLAPHDMRSLLEEICAREHVKVEESVYPLVIRAGGGSPRDSLSVLDQLLAGAGSEGITYEHAVGVLGITDSALLDSTVEAVANQDPAALFATINDVLTAGHDPRRFASDLIDRFRDLLVLQSIPDAFDQGLVDAPANQRDALRSQAESIGPATLARCAAVVSEGLNELKGATSPRLLLEIMCARLVMPGASEGVEALAQRVEQLESGAPATGQAARPSRSAESAGVGASPAGSVASTDSQSDTSADGGVGASRASGGGLKYERPSVRRAREAAQKAKSTEGNPAAVSPDQNAAPNQPSVSADQTPAPTEPTVSSDQTPAPESTESSHSPEAQPESAEKSDTIDPSKLSREELSRRLQEQALEAERELRAREAEERMRQAQQAEGSEGAVDSESTGFSVDSENTEPQYNNQSETQPAETAEPEESISTQQATNTEPKPEQDPESIQGEESHQSATLTRDELKELWPQIMKATEERNRAAQIIMSQAVILGVYGDRIVLGHHTGALAQRLNTGKNNEAIASAIKEVTNKPFTVECTIGTDSAARQRWEKQHAHATEHKSSSFKDAEGKGQSPDDHREGESSASPSENHNKERAYSYVSESARSALSAAAAWAARNHGHASGSEASGRDGAAHSSTPSDSATTTHSDSSSASQYSSQPTSPLASRQQESAQGTGLDPRGGFAQDGHSAQAAGSQTAGGNREHSAQGSFTGNASQRGGALYSDSFSDGVPLPPEPDEYPEGEPEPEIDQAPPAEEHSNPAPRTERRSTAAPRAEGGATSAARAERRSTAARADSRPNPASRTEGTRFNGEPSYTEEEAEEALSEAREPGNYDHRTGREIAMELLQKELGAKPL